MAGIYLHIPFCRSACYYCDFFFTVSIKHQARFINCLKKEIRMRHNYLEHEEIKSIYFGGGTPSIIPPKEISEILQIINKVFKVAKNPEITLEANPDDLSERYLKELAATGVNRLSIGVQSFFDEDLAWMNRRHSGTEAINSIKSSQEAGFKNLNIDLIYGFPLLSKSKWQSNLQMTIDSGVTHISSYMLGIEPKTVFWVQNSKGKLKSATDEQCIDHFEQLLESFTKAGYIHYEISNFCLPGFYSKHNTSYWSANEKYLGVGPSAHSYNCHNRQWNIRSLTKYMEAIECDSVLSEIEQLNVNTKYNDYILTSLRTMWGLDYDYIEKNFGKEYLLHFKKESIPFVLNGEIIITGNKAVLAKKGMLISDSIISSLFII